ncbi:MAG: nucleoside 2-deoxyribosyltransferase [Candidatus Thorarchaeota archaeon]|jgi:nucleoside 2-deoxyribosyltransferase
MTLVYLSAPIIKKGLRKDEFCNTVVKVIEDLGINIFAPQFLGPAEPDEIYRRDVHNVRMCDFVVAEISNPSLGVGMEVMLAIELMKPVLMFHETDTGPLSRMIIGAEGKVLLEYSNIQDVERILRAHNLENLIVQKCPACNSHVAEVDGEDLKCVGCGFGIHQATV